MRIAADTNLIVRVLTQDNPAQYRTAQALLERADMIIMPITMLCEVAWVLRATARWRPPEIARAFRTLLDDPRVHVDMPMAEKGIAFLEEGGDFADAVIAADGRRLGAETFATFDRAAARLLEEAGEPVTLLT